MTNHDRAETDRADRGDDARLHRAIGWADARAMIENDPAEAERLLVDLSRRLEFIEILADGGKILVNGRPWRDIYSGLEALVSDPAWSDDERIAHSPVPDVTRAYLAAAKRRKVSHTTTEGQR